MEQKVYRGTTSSGFKYEINQSVFNDMELLEDLADIEKNPMLLKPICERILGKEGKKALYDSVRTKDGRVPIDEVEKQITEIMKSEDQGKN